MVIYLPTLKEQEKIADFLSGIDEKIEKVSDELEKMEEFKKGLLQGMFV
jgi:type I restriction enzyme, S subunit